MHITNQKSKQCQNCEKAPLTLSLTAWKNSRLANRKTHRPSYLEIIAYVYSNDDEQECDWNEDTFGDDWEFNHD